MQIDDKSAHEQAQDQEVASILEELKLWCVLEVYDECARLAGAHTKQSGYPTDDYKQRCLKRLDEALFADVRPVWVRRGCPSIQPADEAYQEARVRASWRIDDHPHFAPELRFLDANKLVVNARELRAKGWRIVHLVKELCWIVAQTRAGKLTKYQADGQMAKVEVELQAAKMRLAVGGIWCAKCAHREADCVCRPAYTSDFAKEKSE